MAQPSEILQNMKTQITVFIVVYCESLSLNVV